MKKGSYDPLTYDVRKTSTVRVMLHGPWLEIRFPKTNLPFRRVHDEDEPTAVDFHSRFETKIIVSLALNFHILLIISLQSREHRLIDMFH